MAPRKYQNTTNLSLDKSLYNKLKFWRDSCQVKGLEQFTVPDIIDLLIIRFLVNINPEDKELAMILDFNKNTYAAIETAVSDIFNEQKRQQLT